MGLAARFEGLERLCEYVARSRYADYLPSLFERFGRGHVHVLFLEEFLASPGSVLGGVLAPLALEESDLPATVQRENAARVARSSRLARARWGPMGRAARRLLGDRARERLRERYRSFNQVPTPPLDVATATRLRAEFHDVNRQLAALLGRSLPEAWTAESEPATA